MSLFDWVFSQLLSYSVAWIGFVIVAFTAARWMRGVWVIVGHALVTIAVAGLDVWWIQSEMRRPEWSGQPDMDIVFMMGMLMRIVLVNVALIPVTWVGSRLLRRKV